MQRLLGRMPRRAGQYAPLLVQYRMKQLPEPPPVCRWADNVNNWGVMGNDEYGNCVIATTGHLLMAWNAAVNGNVGTISDQAVIELSRDMGALRGFNIIDRLNYWQNTGMFGNNLWAWADIRSDKVTDHRFSIWAFGATDIGLQLPAAWQEADVWDTGAGRAYRQNSWGPHSVPLIGYDESFFYCVTWGRLQKLTYAAVEDYCDEAYAIIDPDWLEASGVSPSLFDLPQLHRDLREASA